jgi:hypothetical protein
MGSSTWNEAANSFWRIDLGHLLTIVALVGALTGWLWIAIKDRRARRDDRIKSGALRLLLRILRQDLDGSPIALLDLKARFNAPEMKTYRVAYCGCDWTFKSDPDFEASVYRLDYEMKIEWVTSDSVKFRVR